MTQETFDRGLGALYGLAIGDALGMPTQMLDRESIRARFGAIDGFADAPADHPLAAGMPAGSVTDDTLQALVLAEALIAGGGHLDQNDFVRRLLAWEDGMRARGSLDLLGPSTTRAVAAVIDGAPVTESGRFGTTNGAAMRIAPVGLLASSHNLDALVALTVETCLATHNTSVAIAGAAAVGAAVSAGIDGAGVAEASEIAARAAEGGARCGYWVAAASVARRMNWAMSMMRSDAIEASLDDVYSLVGTSLATQESVPAAFALLALFPDDPWRACTAAASLGGDTDTIGAMVGAIAGACHGIQGWPADAVERVRSVNHLDLESVTERLLALRDAT